MALAYRAIGWNRQKRLYDLAIGALLLLGLAGYAATVPFFPALLGAGFAGLTTLHLVAFAKEKRLDCGREPQRGTVLSHRDEL